MVSYAEKLGKLEARIEKRKAAISELTEKLKEDLAEYDKLYLTALADKYKLKGKDLFSAIEREHEQLEKLREGDPSDDDTDSISSATDKQDDNANKYGSFTHSYTDND